MRFTRATGIAACSLALTVVASATAGVVCSFDGPEVRWRLDDARPGVEVLAHGCVGADAREGSGSERLVVSAPVGDSVRFVCPIGRAPVLDELQCALWTKSNRPGVALAARVVLPRSLDPATGAPRVVLVTGARYDDVGRWQQLHLSGLPKLLAAEVRILRTTPGATVDPREAFVDAIVLVVPGVPNSATVWTDALEVDGIVTLAAALVPSDPPPAQGWRSDRPMTAIAPTQPPVARQGAMVTVSGRAFFSRGIDWNDEPLAQLAARGFNTVWTDELPSPEDMAEAARINLWFVCPPPRPDAIAEDGLAMPLDRVLAWNLGRPETPHELDYFRRWAELVRQRDPLEGRVILIAPTSDWLPYSKVADVIVAEHAAAARLPTADFGQWLRTLPLLAQPGTPFWVSIPTEPGPAARRQAAGLLGRPKLSAALDADRLEALVHTAAMAGIRGVRFRSNSSLDAGDDVDVRRALAVEAVNRQLQLIEPWLTGGKSIGQASAVDSTETATVLLVDRARLVIPSSWHAPSAAGAARTPPTSLIVPGVPESNGAYSLSPAGLRTLESKRVAGGVRVTLHGPDDALLLITEDRAVITSFRRRFAQDGRRAVQLQRDLAAAQARALAVDAHRLASLGVRRDDTQSAIGAAQAEIGRANSLLAAGRVDEAFDRATAARRRLADAADLQRSAAAIAPLNSLPLDSSSDAVVEQVQLLRALAELRGGDNRLEGGEFEDLSELRRLGWQHVSDPVAGIASRVELSPSAPHAGRYALQISAAAVPPAEPPQVVARPLVWITTPPVRAEADQVLEITGWVRVPTPIAGSIDGLAIVDSLGGPELALRVTSSPDWQPFRLVRSVSETTDVTLSFALAGLGTASIDGVAIRTLTRPTAQRLPPVAGAQPPPVRHWQPAETSRSTGPLFPAPGPR